MGQQLAPPGELATGDSGRSDQRNPTPLRRPERDIPTDCAKCGIGSRGRGLNTELTYLLGSERPGGQRHGRHPPKPG